MTAFVHNLNKLQKVDQAAYQQAVQTTLTSIQGAVSVQDLTYYSNRPSEEVEALQKEVANIVPAGNIVALVTSGLASLRGRKLPKNQAHSDINALMRGLDVLPNTLFGALFVPTAAVLSAYQTLLTLTGKDSESAFPNGLWQFYLEFAMREDSAHHTNETIGFQTALADYELDLSEADQLSAWVCAISQLYFQYDDILHNEWREVVSLSHLNKVVEEAGLTDKTRFKRLFQSWGGRRPYNLGDDFLPDENYATYRWRRFNNFLGGILQSLPQKYHQTFKTHYEYQELAELTDFQEQMTILATLQPERYREVRQLIPIWQTQVGIIVKGQYFLIPACSVAETGHPFLFESLEPDANFYPLPLDEYNNLYNHDGKRLIPQRNGVLIDERGQIQGYLRPAHFETVRQYVTAILEQTARLQDRSNDTGVDVQLRDIPRPDQARARQYLSDQVHLELSHLQTAPVLINWDEQSGDQPLAYLRQAKRGINDHALTIFRTHQSMVFDQSHIFFDGILGLAISEILTGEAINWAIYFDDLPEPETVYQYPTPLQLTYEANLSTFSSVKTQEVSAETTNIDLSALVQLRAKLPHHHFKADQKPTINDFIILYRGKFGVDYQPSPPVRAKLDELLTLDNPQAQEAHALIDKALQDLADDNPSILIPLNASMVKPRDRLYPTTFRNPFTDLWVLYNKTSQALMQYQQNPSKDRWRTFADNRGALLTNLDYFSKVLTAYKNIAMQGESASSATMRLLAYLPDSLRNILNEIPQRIDVLNEIIKGEEVISNVGRVARDTSLTRFISAKDDNENKTLIWGIITDDKACLHLSLRDFRPHVATLIALDRRDLAEMIVTDQIEAFARGFNQFVGHLTEIIQTKVIQ